MLCVIMIFVILFIYVPRRKIGNCFCRVMSISLRYLSSASGSVLNFSFSSLYSVHKCFPARRASKISHRRKEPGYHESPSEEQSTSGFVQTMRDCRSLNAEMIMISTSKTNGMCPSMYYLALEAESTAPQLNHSQSPQRAFLSSQCWYPNRHYDRLFLYMS